MSVADPRTPLRAGSLYSGDNGRVFCASATCAGATAFATGRDLSGQRVTRLEAVHYEEARRIDFTPTCEGCGATGDAPPPSTQETTMPMNHPGAIAAFTPTVCRQLHDEICRALAPIGAKYGIILSPKPGRYSPSTYRFTTEATCGVGIDTRDAEQKDRETFGRYAARFGLKPEHFGHVFTAPGGGAQYRICGIKPQAPKFPVLAKHTRTGTVYKFPVESTGLVSREEAAAARESLAEMRAEARFA